MSDQIPNPVQSILFNKTVEDSTNLRRHIIHITKTRKMKPSEAFNVIYSMLSLYEWHQIESLTREEVMDLFEQGCLYDLSDVEQMVKCYNSYDSCQLGMIFSEIKIAVPTLKDIS